MHAPPFELPPNRDARGQYSLATADPGSLAYSYTCGAAAFFVLDTRTMRIKSRTERTILGEGQWRILENWLLSVKDAFPVKFLVTSCSLLFDMWIDVARDRWSGFPAERDRLLHFLAAHAIKGVYLLTGDLHSAHAVRAGLDSPQGPLPLWEFCATPFEQATNWLSSRTYRPPRSAVLKSQKLYFSLREPNFGLVRVDFSIPDNPHVTFEVYGKTGELLAAT
jgi:phosphodiesterase/alkaline phosphatase D-like protein